MRATNDPLWWNGTSGQKRVNGAPGHANINAAIGSSITRTPLAWMLLPLASVAKGQVTFRWWVTLAKDFAIGIPMTRGMFVTC